MTSKGFHKQVQLVLFLVRAFLILGESLLIQLEIWCFVTKTGKHFVIKLSDVQMLASITHNVNMNFILFIGKTILSVDLGQIGTASLFILYNYIKGVATDKHGCILFCDWYNHCIKKISIEGNVTTVAGTGYKGYKDGKCSEALFDYPSGIAIDDIGNIYVTEDTKIRKINLEQDDVCTIAGSKEGCKDGKGTNTLFNRLEGIALDGDGNIYVADYSNKRISMVNKSGEVTTIAGSGKSGKADGLKDEAEFEGPIGIAFDNNGNLYV